MLPPLLGWNDPFLNSATFDVMLHGGTLVALLIYFWREFVGLAAAFVASLAERRIGADPERRLAWLVLLTLVPAAVLGFTLEDFFDTAFRERLIFIALFLVGGAAFLWAAEWYAAAPGRGAGPGPGHPRRRDRDRRRAGHRALPGIQPLGRNDRHRPLPRAAAR